MAGHYNRFSHTNGNKVKTCWTRQELFLNHIHQKTKTLILSDTGTVTEDDITDTTHSKLTVHTVSLLYFHYYYFQPNCKSEDTANWTASEIRKIQLTLPVT